MQQDFDPPSMPAWLSWIENEMSENRGLQSAPMTANPGDILIKQDSPLRGVWLVLEGEIEVSRLHANGRSLRVGRFAAPILLGEMEWLSGKTESLGTMIARTRVTYRIIPGQLYDEWMHTQPELAYATACRLARLTYLLADGRMEDKLLNNEQKLVLFLLRQLETPEGERSFRKLTREALCEYTGLSLRTLNRLLSQLQQDGYLHLQRGKLAFTAEEKHKLRLEGERLSGI